MALTGATGAVGGRVAAALGRAGVPSVLVVRNPERAPQVAGAAIRVASGYVAGEEMRAALHGIETLFLVPATESADRVREHATAVDAAVAAGARRIVYLSFLNAAPDATFTLAREHWHTEEYIRATDLEWTFLRMNLYLDSIPSMVGEGGVLRGPAGTGRVSAVSRDDVAAASAAVLLAPGHAGRTYDLTGPESFTLARAAELMAATSGKAIRFEDESADAALASRRRFGAPDWMVRGWVSSYQAIRDGSLEGVSTSIRRLTGHDPIDLAGYLRAHPDSLAHVDAS